MSNYPFGLRGDPFVPPATLSAKEASRLIRRRIRACNGDGGLLFPIDTCDTIHALAAGVPDAVLVLAGKALAIAAADKARAVSPAHVRQAAESVAIPATGGAATTGAPAAMPAESASTSESQPPAPGGRQDRSDEEDDEDDEPRAAQPAARESQAPPVAPDPAPVEAEIEAPALVHDAESVTAEAGASFSDLDDLPPFRPASVALPTRPSEDLPMEAREWVSRFIPNQPGTPAVAESDAPRAGSAPSGKAPSGKASSRKRGAVPAPEAEEPASLERLAALTGPPPPRRGARPRAGRRSNSSRVLVGALGMVAVLAIVIRYSTPGHLARPDAESKRAMRTSTSADERRSPEPAPAVTVAPRESRESAPQSGSAFSEARPAGGSAPLAGAEDVPTVEPARRAAPMSRYGLEVASFIFEERARQERDRLATAGLQARVVTTLEFGSRVYRVVIGGYPHPAAAERAADSLLSNGVVLQARVVTSSGR